MDPLEKEFNYFLEHQEELLKSYKNKVIVIKDQKVIGVYDKESEAIKETQKTHELGSFLVQRCEPGSNAFSVNLSSPTYA